MRRTPPGRVAAAVVLAASVLSLRCVPTGGETPPPDCTTHHCGGDGIRMLGGFEATSADLERWGPSIAMARVKVTLCRNDECLPPREVRGIDCPPDPEIRHCMRLVRAGNFGCDDSRKVTEPTLCIETSIASETFPKADGDRYRVLVEDDLGTVRVDRTLTATFERVEPVDCVNRSDLVCVHAVMAY